MKIHVFDVDQPSRRVFDRTWRILASKSAKNDPKRTLQNDPKSIRKRCQKIIKILIDFGPFWVRFWLPLGSFLGAFWRSKIVIKSDQKLDVFRRGSKRAPRGSRRSPRGSQEAPRGPQEAPRGPKRPPRGPQEAPRGPQELPKRVQEAPKSSSNPPDAC